MLNKITAYGAAGIVVVLAVLLFGHMKYREGFSDSSIKCKQAAIAAVENSSKQKVNSREKFQPYDHTRLVDYLSKRGGLRDNE